MITRSKAKRFICCLCLIITTHVYAQKDSVQLNEVIISSYLGDRPVLRLPASVALIDSSQLTKQAGQSLVPVLNTIPGVRMEERSPGSYRLSIRGSLIRSPFGIRNTKLYIDEYPLTNAGGDAYLNLLDMHSISSVEILKGPDGSLFGANSGGVVRLNPYDRFSDTTFVRIGLGLGSYGMFQQNVALHLKQKRSTISINEAWQRSDGYRENSAMDRKFFQISDRINYNAKGQLRLYFFYSDLKYETPGGLTLAQFNENPKQARPATKVIPGAIEQNASIRNRTFFGGVTHEYKINNQVKHVISIFGSQTLFENPFITNYEVREEANVGTRTWFEFSNKEESRVRLKFNVGGEYQALQSAISNYGNRKGSKDTVQARDQLEVQQGFVFTRLTADFNNKWITEVSLSYNANQLLFSRTQPIFISENKKILRPEFMPRAAASYIVNKLVSFRGIISRGYSPPTLQEIRSSDNTVNTALHAERGWNYELGMRLRDKSSRIYCDVSAFYYELKQTIVKRENALGQDYFVNAGTTYQPGVESLIRIDVIKQRTKRVIRGLQLSNAFTFNLFRFGNYVIGETDYTAKELTGVPRYVTVTGLTLNLPVRFYLFAQHNYTARIPLNDLNSENAKDYNLIQVKVGWMFYGSKKFVFDISAGIDNLLDQKYSLGNDLNAAGNRYYNTAAPRNYFGRIVIGF
ncbi:TonB-dependent receptor [Sphingobacteriaceae bacterium]|nr:TonB-dependent receptor [Sphingobacteriaceae bacterium]